MRVPTVMLISVLMSLLAALSALPGCGRGGEYPDRPILLVCPWAVGGGTDRVSRQAAAFLEHELGVPVNVLNATGGGGVTGHSRGAHARPDGYTLTMMTVEINMLRHRKLTTISWEDFTPVMLLNRDAAAVFVHAEAPWKTLDELAAAVRQEPGRLTASGTATGGIWHLALAGWLTKIGLAANAINWIPSRGASPALQELGSRSIDIACCSVPEARARMDTGSVRCLGVMSAEPVPGFEAIPTFRSQGVEWEMGAWRGLGMPRGVPAEVLEKLIPPLRRIVTGESRLDTPEGRVSFPEFMRREGYHATWELPDDFAETLRRTDAELGALLTSEAFASMSVEAIGPMFFPGILFGLLAVVFVALCHVQERRELAHFVEVIAAVVLYILLAETLGFVITAGAILFLLLWRLGTRLWVSALVTVVLVPLVYQIFAIFLRVPLPRGYLGW